LGFLLANLPAPLHLVIAGRADPPLALPLLRSRGELLELRAGDLRFTPEEAAQFLNHVVGLDLTSAEVALLEARTEGWIAALQLAALSMQSERDIHALANSFGGSHSDHDTVTGGQGDDSLLGSSSDPLA
jgi:LuxR family maltose regulon positive regulatory protein